MSKKEKENQYLVEDISKLTDDEKKKVKRVTLHANGMLEWAFPNVGKMQTLSPTYLEKYMANRNQKYYIKQAIYAG